MKRKLSTLLLFAVLNSASALPNFDPFADATAGGGTLYEVGTGLAGQNQNVTNDWLLVNSGSVNPQEPTIFEGNLSYPGLPASTGNCVSNSPPPSGSGRTARLNLRAGTAPSIGYYSFILKVTDVSNVPTTNCNNFIAGFSDGAVGQAATLGRCGGRLVTKQSGAGYVIGIGKGSTLADYAYDTTERAIGDEVFVVVSYERAGGATNVNLWVNPPSESFGAITAPAPNANIPTGASAGDMNNSGIVGFVLSCQTVFVPTCLIDELRVSTNWGTVTGGDPSFPITIDTDPASRTVKVGDRVAFVVGNGGTSPAYQWRLNGTDIPDATDSAYALSSAQTTDAGSYTVVITNVINSLTSNPAMLTVSETSFQLYETNLIVVRVGDGAQPLTTGGNSVYLDQLTTNGTYLNTVFIPDTGASALIESGPDLTGSTLIGTALSRSADKRLMTLAGYNVELGNTTALHTTAPTNVPRSVVTIDSNSQITLAISETNTYNGFFRGAATDGTNDFWGSGSTAGTYYFGLNSPAASVQTTFSNTRSIEIFNGNLYTLASASGFNGLLKFDGLPTTDQGVVPNILTGFGSVNTTDFSVDPTDTLIYVTSSGVIQRWEYDEPSMLWSNAYSITVEGPARYLTVDYSGAAPVIYFDNGAGQLFKVVDTGAASTPTLIAESGPNQLFKGIRFGPAASTVVTPPLLSFTSVGSDLIFNWTGAFFLQSATNVAGPYEDVSGATSPHTNNTASPTQQYFRLRD